MSIKQIKDIRLNDKTAYLAGVIVGDGHISNSKKSRTDNSNDYRIVIEVVDFGFLKEIECLIKSIITTKSIIKKRVDKRVDRQNLYYFQFRNKDFYYFLTKNLGVFSGNKCFSVRVPDRIFTSIEFQKHFLAGLFDADGGIRGMSVGFTSASFHLIQDVSKMLDNLRIRHSCESWENRKYSRYYFGIKILLKCIDRFLNELPFRNMQKHRRSCLHVGVPEWPNGMDDAGIY